MPITSQRQQLLRGESPPANPALDDTPITYNESPDMPWSEFRERYEASGRSLPDRWSSTARLFERLCAPKQLADVTDAMLSRFVDGLRGDGFALESLRSRLTDIRAALKWGFDAGLIDPSQFDVERVRNKSRFAVESRGQHFRWQWRKARKWVATETPGEVISGDAA